MPVSIELEANDVQRVFVRQLEKARKNVKRKPVDFTNRLSEIRIADTMLGSSTLTISVLDAYHSLLTSGFFDARADGKLDPLEINWPVGTDNWWRLTSVEMAADEQLEMTFMETIAVEMQHKHGPLKTARSKKTRAEFIKGLVDGTDKDARFICKQLHRTQPKAKKPTDKVTDQDRKDTKSGGIPRDADLTVKGAPAKNRQIANAEEALDVATELNAPEKAVVALVEAMIAESAIENLTYGDADSLGILQVRVSTSGSAEKSRDISWCVEQFLTKGFYGHGGAIDIANNQRDLAPHEIAQRTQGSGTPDGSNYARWKGEAQDFVDAYGGGGFGGASYEGAYNFTVGGRGHPHETYWDAANRLAEEVKWALFLDGEKVYYDSEQTLIGAKPALTLHRNDPAVVDWRVTWDERHIATELNLTLICEPMAYRAGEVFKLIGFGPGSTGSTAKPKRPGHWLVAQMDRRIGNLATEFTLKQPHNPRPEPRGPTIQGRTTDAVHQDLMDAMHKISRQTPGYVWGGNHGPKFSEMSPSDGFDCSSSVSYALWLADMMPGDTAQVSGWFASSYGRPGRGETFTVWANGGHVFMLGEGRKKWRFDTGDGGSGRGAKFYPDSPRSTAGFTPRHFKGA
jgi:hypothetical protein